MKKGRIRFLCLFLVSLNFLISCTGSVKNIPEVSKTPWETAKGIEKTEDAVSISQMEASGEAERILEGMSLEEKIGQLFLVHLELLDTSKGSYYNFTKINKKMKAAMARYKVGGVIILSRNIETPRQLKKLTADLQGASPNIPLFVAAEEAGGKKYSIFAQNSNLRGTLQPPYYELGKDKTEEEMEQIGMQTGKELKEFGINLNLAPFADIADQEKNPSGVTNCFSSDTDRVKSCVSAVVDGMNRAGIASVLRTFPGMGAIAGKVNEELVNNDNSLMHMREADFLPFRSGIESGADCIMVSNAAVSKITQNTLPASMSDLVVGRIIREELDFQGIVMTDVMNCPVITDNFQADEAAIKVLRAGVDLILMPENLKTAFEGIRLAVEERRIDEKSLNAAVLRILQSKICRGIIRLEEEEANTP